MTLNLRQWLMILVGAVIVVVGGFFIFQRLTSEPVIQASGTATGNAPATAGRNAELMVAGPLGDHGLGDPNAANLIIEYASMTCPHCQRWHSDVYPELKKQYIDTGKVYFIFRDYPLDPVATSAIMIAHCAPADRFFPLVDLLFDQQASWAFVNDPKTALQNVVKQAGIGEEQFNACLTNQSILDGVYAVKNRATETFKVGATPTFFINGVKRDGEIPLSEIEKLLKS